MGFWHDLVRAGRGGVVAPHCAHPSAPCSPRLRTADRLTIYASTIGLHWPAATVVGWRCDARGLTAHDLGLSFGELPLTIATGLAFSLLLGGSLYYNLRRLARVPADREGIMHQIARTLMPQNLPEALIFVGLPVTVALCEEFLYRGFAVAALEHAAGGSLIFAALASSPMFALAHLYQGRGGIRATFVDGLVFATPSTWTHSLAPPISAHMVTDLLVGPWPCPRRPYLSSRRSRACAGKSGQRRTFSYRKSVAHEYS